MTRAISYSPASSPTRWVGVTALHILLGWALVSGTDIPALKNLRKPLETLLIQDVALLPPPPTPQVKAPRPFIPPPEIVVPERDSATGITATAQPAPEAPSPVPVVASVAPAPAPAPALPEKIEAALICPGQVRPVIPRQAYIDNIQGLVQAQATVQDGQVRDVRIVSGPRIFHDAVKTAMRQYRCSHQDGVVVAMQSFNFRFE
jgi:protein TonB